MTELSGRALVDGEAVGDVVVLEAALSFWGGYDVDRGCIIGRHPQAGTSLQGRVVVMPSGRGSSSSSSVLAEAIRAGTAPAAVILMEPDEILTLGAIVAAELYGMTIPILVVDETTYRRLVGYTRLRVWLGGALAPG